MMAEMMVLKADGLVHFPQHLSFEEAAALPCAAVTAWNALFSTGKVIPGETVLTLGSGGVSTFAIRFAKMAGARVIATTGTEAKAPRLRELGADHIVNYRSDPEWHRQVRELTGGVGVDHVVEVGGAGTLPNTVKSVKRGGYIALIGVLAGRGEFDPRLVLLNAIRLNGVFVGSRAMFEEMNRAIGMTKLRPVMDRLFEFGQFPEALEYLESGAHFGKIGISVTPR
jgi:NADPH:quinone reductase-like Zn-dependent oxidoreductase